MVLKLIMFTMVFAAIDAVWQLYWQDEFHSNQTSIDTNKWSIENEVENCDGSYHDQLNCKKNDKNNLWLIDGTLAIAAVWNVQDIVKNNGKSFTSALIKTEQDFSFSRIEVRAALPRGKLLRPAIYLEPKLNTGNWPQHGSIDIMVNAQNKRLWHGVHALFKNRQSIGSEDSTLAKLNDFHTYILEWNESMVVWKFDQDTLQIVNLTKELDGNENPFKEKFSLAITLGVGGPKFFPDSYIDEDIVRQWKCSLFILDYVRIYNWVEGPEQLNTTQVNDPVSSRDICGKIMPKIGPPRKFPLIIVVSVIGLILFSILMSSIVFLLFRLRMRRQNHQDYYDDTNCAVFYDAVNEAIYEDPYPMNDDIDTNIEANKNREYLQITNNYV